MTSPQQQIIERCKTLTTNIKTMYGINLDNVRILFNLKGRAAGMATKRGNEYSIRFNADMLTRDAFDHVLNNTVPHEFAHIVCFIDPRLGDNHNAGWQRVCASLGGNAQTRHTEDVVYSKGATYEYTTTSGHAVRVSQVMHGKIQRGTRYTYRAKGMVTTDSPHTIVGVRGRTLAEPVTAPKVNPLVTQARNSYTIGVSAAPTAPTTVFPVGVTKAAMARAVMLAGHCSGIGYDAIIDRIVAATGHNRQLSKAYYKNNAARVGITQ